MAFKALAAAGTALLLAGFAQDTRNSQAAQLDALLRAAVEARQVPAVVAMVATKDRVVYQGSVGLPVDTIFNIASMTKPVTAVAAMQLVEAGKVRLDAPAHTYVPALRGVQVLEGGALRPPKSPPTVRHLLTHTSGFGYEFLNREISDYVRAGKVATMFAGTDGFLSAPLATDPGTRWEYGISADWLGKLVEAVAGESLDAYFRSRIFEPLGMSDTYYNVPADKQPRLARVHARQADGSAAAAPPQPVKPVTFFPGGGGLYSTASDYVRFTRALLAGGQLEGRRILKAETVETMGRNQIGELTLRPLESLNPSFIVSNVVLPGSPDVFGFGVALNTKALPAGRGAGTMSWAGVFNTFFWVDREKGLSAVLMTQMLPFGDPEAIKLAQEFDRAVYRLYGSRLPTPDFRDFALADRGTDREAPETRTGRLKPQ
jgi:methyl acetate hydrolase